MHPCMHGGTYLEWPNIGSVDIKLDAVSPAVTKLLVGPPIHERHADPTGELDVGDVENRGVVHYELVVGHQNHVHRRNPRVFRHQPPRPLEVRRVIRLFLRVGLRVLGRRRRHCRGPALVILVIVVVVVVIAAGLAADEG